MVFLDISVIIWQKFKAGKKKLCHPSGKISNRALTKRCRYYTILKVDIQVYQKSYLSFSSILRPSVCPVCNAVHPLRKHGSYKRYICTVEGSELVISILRYYCPQCRHTVSYLPSFAVPRRQFSAALISICLQLVFACGSSFRGIERAYPSVSRILVGNWIKSWYYSSKGIISVMRSMYKSDVMLCDLCSGHKSLYITQESLESFYTVSDFVIGYELCNCNGKCDYKVYSCRDCSEILKKIQESFSSLPFKVQLL